MPRFHTHCPSGATTRQTSFFYLVVNDFGIKYSSKSDADHLLKSLRDDYDITEDWTGEKYLGLTYKWD